MKPEKSTPSFIEWLRLTNIADLSSNKLHSRDFNGSRAEYIYMRLRFLSLIFALMALVWIPFDILFTPNEVFGKILGLRISYSAMFLFLGIWSLKPQSLFYARLRLAFFAIIPSLFYISSKIIFKHHTDLEGVLIGYSFLPFLTVVLFSIFPLTLLEGISYIIIVIASFLMTALFLNELQSISAWGDLWLLALLGGISIWAQLAQLHMLLRLYREASRDALTGLVNRAVLNKWIEPEFARVRLKKQDLSAMLIDLDLFKRVNDTYGHLTGDQVLKDFSAILKSQLTGYNLIGRYGGEEFLAILPNLNSDETVLLAERIQKRCRSTSSQAINGEVVKYTVSIGVSQLNEDDTVSSLIDRADKCLYQAKMQGRDRVVNVLEEQ